MANDSAEQVQSQLSSMEHKLDDLSKSVARIESKLETLDNTDTTDASAMSNAAKMDEGDALSFRKPSIFRKLSMRHTESAQNPTAKEAEVTWSNIALKSIPGTEELCYATNNANRGLCLIIENDRFSPNLGLSDRKGSEVDLESCKRCFLKLGFSIRVEQNLNYTELMRILETIAIDDEMHANSDAFVMVMLSHGNEGTVYAYDSALPTQRLWEPFTGDQAVGLRGKPKLFFLQACQGAMMDEGYVVRRTATDNFASYKVPVHTDFVVAHSTITGHYSWRNTVQGSWYVQSLCKVLEEKHNTLDLISMLTLVTKRVAEEYESSSSRKEFNFKKQTPFFFSTLSHKLFLEDKKTQE